MTLEFEYVQLTTCAYRNYNPKEVFRMGYNKKVVINGISFNFAIKSESEARIEIAPATSNATPIDISGNNSLGILFSDDAREELLDEVFNLLGHLKPGSTFFQLTNGKGLVPGAPVFVNIRKTDQPITKFWPYGHYDEAGVAYGAVSTMMDNMFFAA